jgi:hypothetical protein
LTAATVLVVLAASGCAVNDQPKSPSKQARSSAKARCVGQECRVRVICKGTLHIRVGSRPVRIRTSKTVLRTTIFVDFAGSRDDATIRC